MRKKVKNIFFIFCCAAFAAALAACPGVSGEAAVKAPSNFSVTELSNGAVKLAWTDNADNEDGFNIYWSMAISQPSVPSIIAAANATSAIVTGLEDGAIYYFWLESYNDKTTSDALVKAVALTFYGSSFTNLYWYDEFDGSSVDTTKWGYDIGDGGWGNNESETYTAGANNSVSGGVLTISVLNPSSGYYTSTRMKTKYKFDFTYGKIVIRAKLPYGQGMWPAFWLLPTDNVYGTWPNSGEIDIMESLGNYPNKIYGTAHTYDNHGSAGRGGNVTLSDVINTWHEYCAIWSPTSIKWYVDGNLYATVSKAAGDTWTDWPFDRQFHIIMNVAVGGDWPGYPDGSTTFPQYMYVDYVRVYR